MFKIPNADKNLDYLNQNKVLTKLLSKNLDQATSLNINQKKVRPIINIYFMI